MGYSACTSIPTHPPPGRMVPPALPELLKNIASFQRADGHFGRDVNWNEPLEPESPSFARLAAFNHAALQLYDVRSCHRLKVGAGERGLSEEGRPLSLTLMQREEEQRT